MTPKEKLEKVRENLLSQAEDIHEFLNQSEPYANIKKAYWENGKIVVEFDTNVDIDIKYWFMDKIHEVEDYVDKIDQTKGIYRIGVNQFDKNWNVQLIGEVDSKPVNVGAYEVPEPPAEPEVPQKPENKEILFGWWGSDKTPAEVHKYANVGFLESPNATAIEEALQYNNKVIPMIGGFGATGPAKTNHLIEKRAGQYYKDVFEKYKDHIPYAVIQDEPYSRGKMTPEQIKLMCDAASTLPVKTCITITRATVFNDSPIIPDSVDIIQVQAFPFFKREAEGYQQIWTKQEFMNDWDNILTTIQKKARKPVMITAQGFEHRNWRTPPDESPLWYAELVQKCDFVKGLIWYTWHDKSGIGINKMPGVFENVKKAYSILK